MADYSQHTTPFLAQALDQWQTANTAESDQRTEGQTDLEFLNLQQWDPQDVLERGQDRPSLVIDQIGEPYRQLVGLFRRAHPGIQISAVDNGADVETAERYQGAIRHIEVTGGAKAAREEAFKGMAGPGWGYYRLYTDYDYDSTPNADPAALFDQCIKYQAIENQFTVFRDPACPIHEPWKARFCLIIEDIPKEEFKRRWPGKAATSEEAFQATGLSLPDWYPSTSVRVADYFYLETVPGEPIAQLSDGQVVPVKQAKELIKATPELKILQERTPNTIVVKLAKITGAQVLEGDKDLKGGIEQPWPFIPVVPMFGEALTVKGVRGLRGMVRAARDPQRMYNYQTSELVYELALAPKSKVIMAEGQDEGYEAMWEGAPRHAWAALKYKPTSFGGERVSPPEVAHFTDSAKIQALSMAVAQFKSDLRSTTGWYDSTDPNRKNADQSGRAILARKEAQTEGAVNYMANAHEAIHFEAMLLLGAIPKLYNRPGRGIRIAGLEDETKSKTLTIGDPKQAPQGKEGEYFQWGAGRYDVVISEGASYATRRQEGTETTLEVMKVVPEPMAASIAPLAVRNMDIPNAKEMADRMDRTLPPEVRGPDESQGTSPIPPEVQMQLQQAKAKEQEMMQVIQGLQEAIKGDVVKAEAESAKTSQVEQTKWKIAQLNAEVEAMKVRAELIKLSAELDAEAGKVAVVEETKRLMHLADLQLEVESMSQPTMMGVQ